MRIFECRDTPIQIFGLPYVAGSSLMRLPESIMAQFPHIRQFGSRSTGGRVCFRTNSKTLWVRLIAKTFIRDYAIPQISSSGLDVYAGPRPDGRFLGSVFPTGARGTDLNRSEAVFTLDGTMQDITVFLPKNEVIDQIFFGIDDDAVMEAPTPYRNPLPVIFYGSSITEGGCASRTGNTYIAFLSRWLNMDYINFGFSGSARGEAEIARFIASMPMSVFVYDYDYNAPTVEHLAETHEPFFRIIRERHPELPVIMLSRPNYASDPAESEQRAAIIRRTYENARGRGDRNVYFICGKDYFTCTDVHACTVDRTHPNDLGFYLMAKKIREVLEPLLPGNPL